MTALSRYDRKALWLLVICAAALGLPDLSARAQTGGAAAAPSGESTVEERPGYVPTAGDERLPAIYQRQMVFAPRSPQAQSLSIRPIVIYTSSKETAEQYGTGSALGVTVFSGRAYNA